MACTPRPGTSAWHRGKAWVLGTLRGEGVLTRTVSPCQQAPGTQRSQAHSWCPISEWGSQRWTGLDQPPDYLAACTSLLGRRGPGRISQRPTLVLGAARH